MDSPAELLRRAVVAHMAVDHRAATATSQNADRWAQEWCEAAEAVAVARAAVADQWVASCRLARIEGPQ